MELTAKHQKSQVGKGDLSPLLCLTPVGVNRNRRSGDKSLFPTCEFLKSNAGFTLWPSLRWPYSSRSP